MSEAPTAETTNYRSFRHLNTPSPSKLMRHKLKLSNAGDSIINPSFKLIDLNKINTLDEMADN